MKTYMIQYLRHRVPVRGENAVDAVRRYGARHVFGRRPIFHAVRVTDLDAATGGQVWAVCLADGIKVSSDLKA